MSQPYSGHRPAGRCPPVPIPKANPASPGRWPIVATAGALAGLFLALLILTAWMNRPLPLTHPNQTRDAAAATAEAPQEAPPPGDAVLPEQKDPRPAGEQPPPAAPGAEAVAAAAPAPVGDQPLAMTAVDRGSPACESFGTAVDFLSSPTDAARQAGKAGKLLFVLHISGNFEDDKFT